MGNGTCWVWYARCKPIPPQEKASVLTLKLIVLGSPHPKRNVAVIDNETGFTFSEYKVAYSLTGNVVFRVATPADAVQGQPFDIVLQIISPTSGGWAAIAWGGTMPKNPITVGWANGNTPVVSSRWAT